MPWRILSVVVPASGAVPSKEGHILSDGARDLVLAKPDKVLKTTGKFLEASSTSKITVASSPLVWILYPSFFEQARLHELFRRCVNDVRTECVPDLSPLASMTCCPVSFLGDPRTSTRRKVTCFLRQAGRARPEQ